MTRKSKSTLMQLCNCAKKIKLYVMDNKTACTHAHTRTYPHSHIDTHAHTAYVKLRSKYIYHTVHVHTLSIKQWSLLCCISIMSVKPMSVTAFSVFSNTTSEREANFLSIPSSPPLIISSRLVTQVPPPVNNKMEHTLI